MNINLFALIVLTSMTVSVSIISDIYQCPEIQNHWFQRSGSLLVIYGALFEAKYILRSIDGSGKLAGGLAAIGGPDEKTPLWSIENIKRHAGFFTILIGTLIWGYGDLIL